MTALTGAQRAAFDADGYVGPFDLLAPDELARCREQLAGHLTSAGGLVDARLRINPHLLWVWVAELVRHPAILDKVQEILGPDLIAWRSVFFIKAARDPRRIEWHNDLAYWERSEEREVSAWIALTDSTTENGCVRVIPGSHRGELFERAMARSRSDRLMRMVVETEVGKDGGVPIELLAGQFDLHHGGLLHRSPGNPTEKPRIGLAVRYVPSTVRAGGPYTSATLVRGKDFGLYELEPSIRFDYDPVTVGYHRRSLRSYGIQGILELLRRPTPSNLARLARLARRRDLVRSLLPFAWRSGRTPG
jgi:non-heme Fe2+,alpha-ketoglutarate-dependent halogenase